jgi:hypothetical protein
VTRGIHALVEDADNVDACVVEFIKHSVLADNQAPQIRAIFCARSDFRLFTQTPNPQLKVSHITLALSQSPRRF